jgi:hypothetical protein
MRKTLPLLLLAAAAAIGCEDNPDGFYKRAPAGAGNRWNNGKTPPTYDPNAKNQFTDSFNSSSKQDLCSGAEKHERWGKMVRQPLIPPRMIAGIDLAGGDDWTGLDFRKAESTLCQSKARKIDDPEMLGAAWGDGNEVEVEYSIATNTVVNWQLNPGYRGTLDFKSRETRLLDNGFADTSTDAENKNPFGKHTFSISIGNQMLKDGRPHEIHWLTDCTPTSQPGDACWQIELTEMYDALMSTYAPELQSTQANCVAEQRCLGSKYASNIAVFGVRPLGMYMVVPNFRQQPAASTPSYFYGFYVKLMPFSGADLYLKLDDEGPWAMAPQIGDLGKDCKQHLGLKYGDFIEKCVNINKETTLNEKGQKVNDFVYGKLKGGMSHTKEAFNFSVEAVKIDFLSAKIGDDKTVGDDWEPTPDDVAYEWEMDIRASGKVLNEWTADKKFQTMAATGAIYREYARRVQDDIHAKLAEWYGEKDATTVANAKTCEEGWSLNKDSGKCRFVGYGIGDAHCLKEPTEDFSKGPAKGCTGFEAFMTPGARDHVNMAVYQPGSDPLRVSVGYLGAGLGIKTALKAGDPLAIFCDDPPPNGAGADTLVDGTPVECTGDEQCFSGKCNAPNPEGKRVCKSATVAGGNRDFCKLQYTDGAGNKVLAGSHKRVIDVLGKGKEGNLPPALRDRKFYFRHLAAAIVKYLKAAPPEPTMPQPKDLADPDYMPGGTACKGAGGLVEPWNCEPEPDHLLFDQVIDNSDRDKWEYIDRRFQVNGKEPMKVEYEILINSSNQQNWKYHRKLTRPERALYDAFAGSGADAHREANLRLTNLVGSPILEGIYNKGSASKPEKDAYYCASTLLPKPPEGMTCLATNQAGERIYCLDADPDCPVPPPQNAHGFMLDDYGSPLLTNYKGAIAGFGSTFHLGTNHLKLVETLPYIQSARVTLPFFPDPYHPGTPGAGVAAVKEPIIIADWRPETPANGIRIPVNEQLDRFVPSASLVFGGSSLTLDMDYTENPDHTIRLEAVSSDSYMGNIFLCEDPNTGHLLSIEQYESMDVILEWLDTHSGSRDACQIITRFSAFGDYPQLLAAKGAGVILGVGLGSGVGRITNIQIYDMALQ